MGVDFETAMGRIHAVMADGTVLKNVEVFRKVYTILGVGLDLRTDRGGR